MKITKSNLFFFLLGAIIFTGVGAFAAIKIDADKVNYSEGVTVKDKIDDLYTKVKPNYTGSTTITPSTSTQTLSTNGKILNNNITINPIPATYKNLSQSTTVEANKLLSGYTAYNQDGMKITGTLSTNCISTSFTCSTCNTSSGQVIADMAPTSFILYGYNGTNFTTLMIYDSRINNSKFLTTNVSTGSGTIKYADGNFSNKYLISNNKLYARNWGSNGTFYIMACK